VAALADPLGIRLTGPVAEVVTRSHRLRSLPVMSNRIRVAPDRAFPTLLPPGETRPSVVREEDARLATARATAIHGETA
jgi:NADH dehydrogenase